MGGASRKGPGRYRPGRGAGKRRDEKPVFRTCCIGQKHHRKGLLVVNELHKQLGFSLQELEAGLFTWMAHQFADVLVKALEQILNGPLTDLDTVASWGRVMGEERD